MEAIIAACERSGHYLDGGKTAPELLKALKARLNDTQVLCVDWWVDRVESWLQKGSVICYFIPIDNARRI